MGELGQNEKDRLKQSFLRQRWWGEIGVQLFLPPLCFMVVAMLFGLLQDIGFQKNPNINPMTLVRRQTYSWVMGISWEGATPALFSLWGGALTGGIALYAWLDQVIKDRITHHGQIRKTTHTISLFAILVNLPGMLFITQGVISSLQHNSGHNEVANATIIVGCVFYILILIINSAIQASMHRLDKNVSFFLDGTIKIYSDRLLVLNQKLRRPKRYRKYTRVKNLFPTPLAGGSRGKLFVFWGAYCGSIAVVALILRFLPPNSMKHSAQFLVVIVSLAVCFAIGFEVYIPKMRLSHRNVIRDSLGTINSLPHGWHAFARWCRYRIRHLFLIAALIRRQVFPFIIAVALLLIGSGMRLDQSALFLVLVGSWSTMFWLVYFAWVNYVNEKVGNRWLPRALIGLLAGVYYVVFWRFLTALVSHHGYSPIWSGVACAVFLAYVPIRSVLSADCFRRLSKLSLRRKINMVQYKHRVLSEPTFTSPQGLP